MKLIIAVKSAALDAALLGYPARLTERLERALRRLAIAIQSTVKGDKLSGQVLHVRTGTLRRSINQVVRRTSGGVEAVVGTNVTYAAIHEYGYQGTESVRAHLRTIRQVWGRPVAPRPVQVRSFSRKVDLPARSFLRSTLKAYEVRAKVEIERAAVEALTP